jgi:hypothetical protein
MDPRNLEDEFIAFTEALGVDVQQAPLLTAFDCMLRFYAQARAEGCVLDEAGDMLLFQRGVYDLGAGPMFEIDLTRQVILPDEDDDDAIWQLHLTFRYAPSTDLAVIGEGNLWCHSPSDLPTFEDSIRASPALAAVADHPPNEVVVCFECAG